MMIVSLKALRAATSSALQDIAFNPDQEADWLIAHALGLSQPELIMAGTRKLTSDEQAHCQKHINRRLEGEPLAYILGTQPFWTLDLMVTPDVLIPRSDTECLVEAILNWDLPTQAKILDLGTGSGAIALALKSERPEWTITATDRSAAALKIAQKNAKTYNLDIHFIQADWFSGVSGPFNVIVSNPPYIEANDPHLRQDGLDFEPIDALSSGPSGLDDITQIISQARPYLKTPDYLILEHGFDQAKAVSDIMKAHGFKHPQAILDTQGHARATVAN